jgi:hypothetical protein
MTIDPRLWHGQLARNPRSPVRPESGIAKARLGDLGDSVEPRSLGWVPLGFPPEPKRARLQVKCQRAATCDSAFGTCMARLSNLAPIERK